MSLLENQAGCHNGSLTAIFFRADHTVVVVVKEIARDRPYVISAVPAAILTA
jgi:hypothetical protein